MQRSRHPKFDPEQPDAGPRWSCPSDAWTLPDSPESLRRCCGKCPRTDRFLHRRALLTLLHFPESSMGRFLLLLERQALQNSASKVPSTHSERGARNRKNCALRRDQGGSGVIINVVTQRRYGEQRTTNSGRREGSANKKGRATVAHQETKFQMATAPCITN